LSLGDYDAALLGLDRLTAASGAHPHWTLRRGDILLAAGRAPDARAAFITAIAALDALPPERQHTRQNEALRAHAASALADLEIAKRTP